MKAVIKRILRSGWSGTEILLIFVEIVSYVHSIKWLIDVYGRMFVHHKTKFSVLMTYLSLEASTFQRPDRLSRTASILVNRAENREADLFRNQDILENFTLLVAYSGDYDLLYRMLGVIRTRVDTDALAKLIEGILKFSKNEIGWINELSESSSAYHNKFVEGTEKSALMRFSQNYHYEDEYWPSLKAAISPFVDSNEYRIDNSIIVLVSCDYSYFEIFSKYFCKRIRKKNSHTILFFVVARDLEEVSKIVTFARQLEQYGDIEVYPKIGVHDEYKHDVDFGLLASVERFIIANDVMRKRKTSVLILDIDLDSNFSIQALVRGLKSDVSFAVDSAAVVPWGRYSAGICYFKYSNISLTFLLLVKVYIQFALNERGEWTLDQTAAAVVIDYLERNDCKIEISDTGLSNARSRTIKVPFYLKLRKYNAKRLNT